MIIELLCRSPEELQDAILTQAPVTYVYLRVNKKDAQFLTFTENKGLIKVSYYDIKKDKHFSITFFPPGTNLQTTFNKRRTKATIIITGSNRVVSEI